MLPFRLRPPALKREKERQAEEEKEAGTYVEKIPLGEGGPLQVAIEKDLLELRALFFQRPQDHDDGVPPFAATTRTVTPHDAEGTMFQQFKRLFATAKIALLHTRCTPLRVDKGQSSQLIYSACLSLIAKAFRKKDEILMTSSSDTSNSDSPDTDFFRNASFGLFCLFALYECNPLPRAPTNDRERLEVCSMGVFSDENTRLAGFRRAYRCPIRLDRYLYTLLLQMRDEALAVQASCQRKRMQACTKQIENRLAVSVVGEAATTAVPAATPATDDQHVEEEDSWTCHCGMATDTIRILDRLSHHLEYCEYDGPCSAEGLAGSANYPFPCKKPTKQQQKDLTERRMSKQGGLLSKNDVFEVLNDDADYDEECGDCRKGKLGDTISTSIVECLQSYQSGLRDLQIPGDLSRQKTTRFQVMLAPVLHSTDVSLESSVAKAVGKAVKDILLPSKANKMEAPSLTRRQLRSRRRVTWAEVDDALSHAGSARADNKGVVSVLDSVVQQDMSYELILPSELSATLQEGIQTALEHILDRDQPLFLPSGDQGANEIMNAHSEEIQDDVSSIGIGGVSLAQNSAPGHREKVLNKTPDVSMKRPGHNQDNDLERPTRTRRPFAARPPQNDFLFNDEESLPDNADYNAGDTGYDSETSNLSASDVEEDVMSVATSAMGQRALAALLSNVSGPKDVPGTRRQAKKTAPKRNGKIIPRKKPTVSDGQESTGTEGKSFASSFTGQGKAALGALLDQADGTSLATSFSGNATTDSTFLSNRSIKSDDNSVSESSVDQGGVAMQSLLDQVERVKQTPTTSERASTKKPRTRRSRRKPENSQGNALVKPNTDVDLDGHSVAESSIGQGKAAMQSLLIQAAQQQQTKGGGESEEKATKEKTNPVRNRKRKQMRGKAKDARMSLSKDDALDTDSIADTSVGQGGAAIQSLLGHVEQEQSKRRSSRRTRSSTVTAPANKRKKHKIATEKEESNSRETDDHSMAASSVGQGKSALAALLSQTRESGDEQSSAASRKRRKR